MSLKNAIQSSNINFLFGSGISMPFLKTLGDVEERLTELEKASIKKISAQKIILASIRKLYFEQCMEKNILISDKDESCEPVLSDYQDWFCTLNTILLNRKNTLLSKQINLFTTNMDIFPETALESVSAEYNNGFYGSIEPIYHLSNYKKSILKTSQHYAVASEVPLFNLLKLHGSLNWKYLDKDRITLDHRLTLLKAIQNFQPKQNILIDPLDANGKFKTIVQLEALTSGINSFKDADSFNALYEELLIVNPTKDKFKTTTMNNTYYEMLRLFSNELERENTLLFAMGFSFADEHIREITLRAIRSNPTLKLIIFAYDAQAESLIKANLGIEDVGTTFPNVEFAKRPTYTSDGDDEDREYPFTLKNINQFVFRKIAQEIKNGK